MVRWYVAYSLSYRDIEERRLERGIKVDPSTLNRWVIHYAHWKSSFVKSIRRGISTICVKNYGLDRKKNDPFIYLDLIYFKEL